MGHLKKLSDGQYFSWYCADSAFLVANICQSHTKASYKLEIVHIKY